MVMDSVSLVPGSPWSVKINEMDAPSTPSNFPVPAPINSLNPADGGFGGRSLGLHSQCPSVRLSMWNSWSGQFTSRLFGPGPAGFLSDPQWISKPCVTRILFDPTKTLPPPVIRPGNTHAKHTTAKLTNRTTSPATFSALFFIVYLLILILDMGELLTIATRMRRLGKAQILAHKSALRSIQYIL